MLDQYTIFSFSLPLFYPHPRTFFPLLFRERGRERVREKDKHCCKREASVGCLPYVPRPGIICILVWAQPKTVLTFHAPLPFSFPFTLTYIKRVVYINSLLSHFQFRPWPVVIWFIEFTRLSIPGNGTLFILSVMTHIFRTDIYCQKSS